MVQTQQHCFPKIRSGVAKAEDDLPSKRFSRFGQNQFRPGSGRDETTHGEGKGGSHLLLHTTYLCTTSIFCVFTTEFRLVGAGLAVRLVLVATAVATPVLEDIHHEYSLRRLGLVGEILSPRTTSRSATSKARPTQITSPVLIPVLINPPDVVLVHVSDVARKYGVHELLVRDLLCCVYV